MKRYNRELTAKELAALSDDEIDFSDIPETDETFWKNVKVFSERKPLDEATKARHKRLLSMGDDAIDYSDIPPTDEKFWEKAQLVIPANATDKP